VLLFIIYGHRRGAVEDDDREEKIPTSKESRVPGRAITTDYRPTIRYTFVYFIIYMVIRFFPSPRSFWETFQRGAISRVILYFAGPDKSRSVFIVYYTQVVLYNVHVNIPTHYIGGYYYYCSSGSSDNRRPEFTNEYLPPVPG